MLALAEAGLAPSFVVGGDVTDAGTGAQWTGSDLLVVEADESDGTHLELPLFATMLTNIEVDHLDHYGSFEAIVDSFDRVPRSRRRPEGAVRRRSAAAPGWRSSTAPSRTGSRPAPTTARLSVHPGAGSFRFEVEHRGTVLGPHRAAAARRAQRRQRRRRRGDGDRARRAVRRDRRGARSLRWSRPSFRRARRRRRGHVRRRLRPPADRDRRRDRRGAGERRQLEAGGRRVPAQPLQPHVGDVARLRRRLRRGRRRRAHGDLLVGHDADPGRHRPPRRRRRPRGPSRHSGRLAAAPRGHRSRSSPARWARATCASRWAVATSPRSPRK